MAHLQTTLDSARDLTVLTLSDLVTTDDVIGALRDFYCRTCTSKAVWDFTRSDLRHAKKEDLAAVLSVAKSYAHLRQGGKTALVVPGDLGFGLCRMYESMAELKDHPVGHGVFRTMADALAWLEAPPDPD